VSLNGVILEWMRHCGSSSMGEASLLRFRTFSFHQCSMNREKLFEKILLELNDKFVPKMTCSRVFVILVNKSQFFPEGCTRNECLDET